MTDGNANEATGVRPSEAQPGSGAASGSAFKSGDRVRLKTPRIISNRNPKCKETATVLWATQETISVQFDGSIQKKGQCTYHPSYFVLLETETPND